MKRKIMIVITVVIMTTGCEKFVDIDAPIDKITSGKVFSSDASATAAVNGIYSQMQPVLPFIFNGGVTINAGLSADELDYTATNPELVAFNTNSLLPSNNIVYADMWGRAYFHIYQANACIEGLRLSDKLSNEVRNRLLGEVLFLRAYFYFYLVNLYGDVPLITSTSYESTASRGRTERAVVYDSLVQDLAAAITLLPDNAVKVRPGKNAAKALLARIYLYREDWAHAAQYATEVIGSGKYAMVNNLANVFLANSNEAIWQLVPVSTTQNTLEGNRFIPSLAIIKPTYVITPSLFAAFESNDLRKTAWLNFNTVSGTKYYYPYKYRVRAATTITEHYMMLRLAEQYLIRAEARAQLDDIDGAKTDVNVTRTRAGLAATTANDKVSVLAAIMKERRTELFAEWGHRWLDLKRSNTANAVLGAMKPGWQPTAVLYPIPQGDILNNPMLVQNPGY